MPWPAKDRLPRCSSVGISIAGKAAGASRGLTEPVTMTPGSISAEPLGPGVMLPCTAVCTAPDSTPSTATSRLLPTRAGTP